MANLVHNHLIVSGENEELLIFAQEMSSDYGMLDFNQILPKPEGEDRIDWCSENWSTKWNADETSETEVKDKELIYHFDTAWNPPFKVIEALGDKYLELEFELVFCDEFLGETWKGNVRVKNGKMKIHRAGEEPFGFKNGEAYELTK